MYRAFQRVEDLEDDLEAMEENPAIKRKLSKAVQEFGSYIDANQAFIPNYGDRYRHDETISTAFVESTVNYVVSKRFVKKQTRTQVLNDDLRKTFCRWYPGMKSDSGSATFKEAA